MLVSLKVVTCRMQNVEKLDAENREKNTGSCKDPK